MTAWSTARKHPALGYAIAAISVAAAAAITQSLERRIFPTPLFFAAIVIATRVGGWGPGLAAVVLSAATLSYFFVLPLHNLGLDAEQVPYVIQFGAPALVTCWFVKKRKDAEESLEKTRDELEVRVRERTLLLERANQDLQTESAERLRAQETVERVQAELAHISRVLTMGELTTSIAHEINQPLMAVVVNGDAALAWMSAEPPNLAEARAAVLRIIAEGTRAGDIIQRIRDFSRKAPLRKAPFDINGLVEETLGLMKRELMRLGVTVEKSLGEGLPAAWGDRIQIQQVLVNLMVNAMEAMSSLPLKGGRTIEIATAEEADRTLVLRVRDSGPGLSADAQEKVFDAFVTTKPGGLGMGLSISRTIAEAHGGRLAAEPSPAGARFRLTLPAAAPESAQ